MIIFGLCLLNHETRPKFTSILLLTINRRSQVFDKKSLPQKGSEECVNAAVLVRPDSDRVKESSQDSF